MANHEYKATVEWNLNGQDFLGNKYSRGHKWSFDGGIEVIASSSPLVVPVPLSMENAVDPEEALIASASSCHMLWFLHLCAESGVIVLAYEDTPSGTMTETADGGGYFTSVTLYPKVKVAEATMLDKVDDLHHRANKLCFIANSVNFPVLHEGSVSC